MGCLLTALPLDSRLPLPAVFVEAVVDRYFENLPAVARRLRINAGQGLYQILLRGRQVPQQAQVRFGGGVFRLQVDVQIGRAFQISGPLRQTPLAGR